MTPTVDQVIEAVEKRYMDRVPIETQVLIKAAKDLTDARATLRSIEYITRRYCSQGDVNYLHHLASTTLERIGS